MLVKVVVALEAASEPIDGLTSLPNPESDGVDRFSQCSHGFLISRFPSFLNAVLREGRLLL